MAARSDKHQVNDLLDVRMCVGRCNRHARNLETTQIVDIVSNVGNLFEIESTGCCELSQRLFFVANALVRWEF
jgi:hypothetical protein